MAVGAGADVLSGASGCTRAKHVYRHRQGQQRRRAAGRHGRSRKPRAHRKDRSVVTDDNGGFRITDLRPGLYTLTFTLAGFATVKRDQIELPSDFTHDHQHGAQGRRARRSADGHRRPRRSSTCRAPPSRRCSTAKRSTPSRPAAPSRRMGQLITGVSLNQPDIGGSKAMQQTYMSAHGAGSSQTTVQVDGLMMNGIDVDGAVQNYFNSSMSQEMVYTTSGASADVAGGGVRLNMIPRDGGNTVQRQPVPRLSERKLPERQPDRFADRARPEVHRRHRQAVQHRRRASAARSRRTGCGSSARRATSCSTRCRPTPSTASKAPARRPRRRCRAPRRRSIRRASAACSCASRGRSATRTSSRSTTIACQEPRLGHDRRLRSDNRRHRLELADLHHRFGQVHVGDVEPAVLRNAASRPTTSATTRSTSRAWRRSRSAPDWYTVINKSDSGRGTQWNAGATNQGMYPDRFAAMTALSYVTGSHNVKVGLQDTWGNYRQFRSANGDIRAVFLNGVAQSATILNTPVNFQDDLKADLGIFAPGLVDDQSADPELRRALGVLRVRRDAGDHRASAASCRRCATSVRSTCRPGPASRRAAAWSTTCSAIRRPRSSSASAATSRPAPPASRTATTRWRC